MPEGAQGWCRVAYGAQVHVPQCVYLWCILVYMRTNIELDETLVIDAMALTGEPTRRAVVHRALTELVRIERLRRLRDARGTLKWQGDLGTMREEGATPNGPRR